MYGKICDGTTGESIFFLNHFVCDFLNIKKLGFISKSLNSLHSVLFSLHFLLLAEIEIQIICCFTIATNFKLPGS